MVEVHVLGPVEVVGALGPARLGGPRQRRLMARLVADMNTVLTTDELIDALWEGVPPEGANRSFKTYIARLRAALDEAEPGSGGAIVTHPGGYCLEIDHDNVDAPRFERQIQRARAELALGESDGVVRLVDDAREMWRGRPFGEFADTTWAEAWGARLEETSVVGEELALEARLAAGHTADALPHIDGLISRFPYRDGLRALRATALYRMGRHVDALRAIQYYRTLLADEVGVEPGPELIELERQILDHDPALQRPQSATRKLRDYELRQRIGADEFAVVYRGVQPSVGRDVAVKVIRPELADDPTFIQRFESEARAMASIEHPHVVPIYDFWREPGGAYLVMRWLGGGSLRDRTERDGALPPSAAARLVCEIGSALITSGRSGLSGAIRSSNIVFDDDDNAYVTAFSIEEHRQAGAPRGGPAHSTGHQDLEQNAGAQARRDVETLGTLLFEALTGRARPGPSESWPPDVLPGTDELARIAAKACAADPEDRFDDVADLLVAVRAAVGSPLATGDEGTQRDVLVADEHARVNPYKGLRAFGEGDSRDFFGREDLVTELLGHVEASPLTCVVGPSGSGKSSIVRAGLVPELRRRGWFVAPMIPGSRPFEELRRALTAVAPVADPALLDRLMVPGDGISRTAHGLLPPDGQMLLVIDQFEELFTLTDTDRRDRFLHGITALLDDNESRVRVVLTLRADFYDKPLLHPEIGPAVRENTMAVTPLDAQQLEAAITQPARLRGVHFEPGLVANLVTDAAANPGNLPLLQYALTELYTRRSGHVISSATYAELGGISGTLAARADQLVENLGPGNEAAVRGLFTRLVTPGEGAEDTRRRTPVGDLPDVPEEVIDEFARARLLTYDRDPNTREPTVEVAHEALIREWPRLRQWVDEDRESLRVHTHLTAAAHAWDERGRDDGDLYRGSRLAAATEYRLRHGDAIAPYATEFLDAAAEVAEAESHRLRRSRRRLRSLAGALGVVVVGAVAAAWLAVDRGNEAADRAREANVAALSAASENLVDADPPAAALLAVEVARRSDELIDLGPLVNAVANRPRRLSTITPAGGPVQNMVVSGDGSRVAVDDGVTVDVFDLATGRRVGSVAEGDTNDLTINADGSQVGVTYVFRPSTVNTPMTIIDVETGAIVAELSGTVSYAIRNPVGDDLAVMDFASSPPTVRLYSSPDEPEPVNTFTGTLLGFSADGHIMLVGPFVGEAHLVATADPLADVTTVSFQPLPESPGTNGWLHVDEHGERLIAHQGDTVQAIEAASGTRLWRLTRDRPIDWVQVGPGGRFATITDNEVQVYDLDRGTEIGAPYVVTTGPGGAAGGAADMFVDLTRDGVLVTGGEEVTSWSIGSADDRARSLFPGDYGVRFSPDGHVVATTSRFAELFIHDIADGTRVVDGAEIDRNGVNIGATPMLFTPDGSRLVTLGGIGPATGPSGVDFYAWGRIRVIDPLSGETVADVTEPSREPTAVALSADGSMLAVGYRGGLVEVRSFPDIDVILNSLETAADQQGTFSGRGVHQLVFDSDGDLLRVDNLDGASQTLVWRSGEQVDDGPFPQDDYLELLPDASLVGGSTGGDIRIYDADGLQVGATLVGHTGSILDVAVANGLMASVSRDGTARLWDLASHQPIGSAIPTESPVVDLSPDGRRLATVESDGTRVLDLDRQALIEAACTVAGRNLTTQEWERYLPSNEEFRPTCPQWPNPTAR